jgi:hypothetical protein
MSPQPGAPRSKRRAPGWMNSWEGASPNLADRAGGCFSGRESFSIEGEAGIRVGKAKEFVI